MWSICFHEWGLWKQGFVTNWINQSWIPCCILPPRFQWYCRWTYGVKPKHETEDINIETETTFWNFVFIEFSFCFSGVNIKVAMKFVTFKLLLAQRVKMCWVNWKLHLVVGKVKPLRQLGWYHRKSSCVTIRFKGSFLVSFLKGNFCPLIHSFWKAKEPKSWGWHATSCNFCLLVKSNSNACALLFVLIKCTLNKCK